MDTTRLRYEVMRDFYHVQRERREHIRNSVATPVAALAFSIFNLSALAANVTVDNLASAPGIAIAILAVFSVAAMMWAARLIVGVERNVVYLDPPDLEEMVAAETQIRRDGGDEAAVAAKMLDLMSGSYDIVYRRYFAANEQAARDRTKGLRLILVALIAIALCFLILPFQAEGG